MFNPFKVFKKKSEEQEPEADSDKGDDSNPDESSSEENEEEITKIKSKKNSKKDSELKEKPSEAGSSSLEIVKISTEIDKINASIESMGEIRKATNEKMSNMSEQIGELRAMILDRDRTIQQLELKAVKASDLVESVQPDKLMSDLQKEDAKFEALKANLEGNEAIIERIMEELKEVRKKIEFFRGIEEIIKLSEEVRKELVDVKKVEATINTQSDKVGTIYAEMRKKFQEIDVFNDSLQEIKAGNSQNLEDIEKIKKKMEDNISKSEFDKLVDKVQRYIDALKEINKSSALTKDLSQLKSLLQNL